ncbi:MAG: TonB-dependent receptor, partial [Candidatus Cloacimonetes bacterium]|nr:TonB-dependent receptor [Candidatus Cloacimonadota bacterium]
IDGEELELRHQGQDLARLLDGTPGLVSFSYGGNPAGYSEIRLRGFDQKRVDVQLNGVPLNDPEDHYVYWVDLPDMGSSLVEAQVQRGTGVAATGGNNFGGAVRLSTGFSPTPGLGLEAGVGSFGTRRQALTWSSGRQQDGWQLETRFSQLRSDGFRERSDLSSWGLAISGRRSLPGGGELRLSHFNGRQLSHVAWDGVPLSLLEAGQRTANSYAAYPNSVDDFRQPQFTLQLTQPLGGWVLDGTLYHIRGDGFYETYKQGEDLEAFGYQPWTRTLEDGSSEDVRSTDLVNRRWIRKHQSGLTLHADRSTGLGELQLGLAGWIYRGEHYGEVLWGSDLPPQNLPGGRYYTQLSHKSRLAPWVRLETPLGANTVLRSSLSLTLSDYTMEQQAVGNFQGSELNRFELSHALPAGALGLSWTRSPQHTLFASLGYSQREPSQSEYWQAWQGSDDLGADPAFARADTLANGSLEWHDPQARPEQVVNLELGSRWTPQGGSLELTVYHMLLRDEIVLYGGVDEESPVRGNAPRSHRSGVELAGQLQLPWQLETGGNAALSRNVLDELVVYSTQWDADWTPHLVRRDFSGNAMALSPELIANAWLQWRPLAALKIRPRLQFVSMQYLDNSEDDDYSELAPGLIDPAFLNADGSLRYRKTLPAYTTLGLDLAGNWTMGSSLELELSLHGDNLLDREYQNNGYWNDWVEGAAGYRPQPELYPAAGRSFMAGLALRF